MKRAAAILLTLALSVLCAPAAFAHKASTSYLHIRAAGSQLDARWDISIRDLDYAIGIDGNGDGAITWGEVRAARERISDYALQRLQLSANTPGISEGSRSPGAESAHAPATSSRARGSEGANLCSLRATDLKIVDHSDGSYAVLYLAGTCPAVIRELAIDYRLFFDLDALHRGLAEIEFGGGQAAARTRNGLFAPDAHVLRFDAAASGIGAVFVQYFNAGLIHVWSGLDHLLFLAGLFLPAVLRRENGHWVAAWNLRQVLRDTALIVTAFTIAHACTLSLAATGAFTVPSRVVESAVALTVLFAGLNNLLPLVYRKLFWLSAVFGLIHGAAVASALIDFGLPARGRVWALLAFNLGVEAAQLSLLALVIFPAYAARRSTSYRRFVLVPGSTLVAVVGLSWFIERAFGVYFGVPLP